MSYKGIRIFVISFLLVTTLVYPASACTGFVIEKNEQILMGLNEDWPYHDNFSIRICAEDYNDYAYVAFCSTELPFIDIRIGLNDQGLAMDSYTIPDAPMNETDKPLFPRNLFDMVLGECAMVDEAISLFERYQVRQLSMFQRQSL
ncbi:MAG: hypothetical protein P1Q69_17640 [Candidatus Thorarchaeota archaeon]|nr:hypothetical protein [Candidatus Thorarchaeota archaeon]